QPVAAPLELERRELEERVGAREERRDHERRRGKEERERRAREEDREARAVHERRPAGERDDEPLHRAARGPVAHALAWRRRVQARCAGSERVLTPQKRLYGV